MNENAPRPVSPDFICPAFRRVPESLIEEPEVCEFCEDFRDGFCIQREENHV